MHADERRLRMSLRENRVRYDLRRMRFWKKSTQSASIRVHLRFHILLNDRLNLLSISASGTGRLQQYHAKSGY